MKGQLQMIIIDTWIDKVYHTDVDSINELMKRLRKAKPGTEFEVSLMKIDGAYISKKRFTIVCKGEE